MLLCRLSGDFAPLHLTLKLWLAVKPVPGILPAVLAEGKRALQSLALALMCFTLEDIYVIVLATD